MRFELKNIIKALLFSTSEPISVREMGRMLSRYQDEQRSADEASEVPFFPVKNVQIREAIEELVVELKAEADVYTLSEGPDGYALTVMPDYAPFVRLLRNEPKPLKLRPASMEALAIVAYRQPVTRAEVESIRGVSSDSALNKLLELDLIAVKGQADLPGRPRLFGTTDTFLQFCGLTCLEDLPSSDVLPTKKITEWLSEGKDQKPLTDQDMGLPEEKVEETAEVE